MTTIAVLLPAFLMLVISVQRWSNLTSIDSSATRQALGWRDACTWAKDKTSTDAMFLIPRQATTFRWYAQRPVFFAWKDVPQDAASVVEWWRRYREAYFGALNEFGELRPYWSLQELGKERLGELAAKHEIDYILTSEYPPLPFPVAYENPWYKIYDLRDHKAN